MISVMWKMQAESQNTVIKIEFTQNLARLFKFEDYYVLSIT